MSTRESSATKIRACLIQKKSSTISSRRKIRRSRKSTAASAWRIGTVPAKSKIKSKMTSKLRSAASRPPRRASPAAVSSPASPARGGLFGRRPINRHLPGKIRFRVEIQEDECNSEQRSQQRLHQAKQEAGEVESLRLVVGRERLEQSLGILGGGELVKIMPDRGPLRPNGERQHKRRPDSKKENASPQRASKPGKVAPAAREFLALAQRAGRIRSG